METSDYDGSGLRVEKSSGTLYWRSIFGDAIAETDLNGNTTSEYVFMPGRRVARLDGSGNAFYYFPDPLGTTRTITNSQGQICYDADFTPYGDEIQHANSCPQNYKFTGFERDTETGLDYAFARYYNNRFGRFMSPDPLGGDAGNPQSLNRYAYVLNNPASGIDPLGLKPYLYQPVPDVNLLGGDAIFGYDIFDLINLAFTSTGGGEMVQNPDLANCEPGGDCPFWIQTPYQYANIWPLSLLGLPGGPAGGLYADIKEMIRQIFKNNPDCADMFGGVDTAISTLDKMSIVNVPNTPIVINSQNDAKAWDNITQANAGKNDIAASTVWTFPAGGYRVGWNGGGYGTYVGTRFANDTPEQQAAILMHEMAHPTTGYPSNYGRDANGDGIIDQPNSPYHRQNLFDNCVHK